MDNTGIFRVKYWRNGVNGTGCTILAIGQIFFGKTLGIQIFFIFNLAFSFAA